MILTREQAVAKYGERIVKEVDSLPCEATSRLIYPAFEPEHSEMAEWATDAINGLRAYYFTPENIDDSYDDWEIDHYGDED